MTNYLDEDGLAEVWSKVQNLVGSSGGSFGTFETIYANSSGLTGTITVSKSVDSFTWLIFELGPKSDGTTKDLRVTIWVHLTDTVKCCGIYAVGPSYTVGPLGGGYLSWSGTTIYNHGYKMYGDTVTSYCRIYRIMGV